MRKSYILRKNPYDFKENAPITEMDFDNSYYIVDKQKQEIVEVFWWGGLIMSLSKVDKSLTTQKKIYLRKNSLSVEVEPFTDNKTSNEIMNTLKIHLNDSSKLSEIIEIFKKI